MRGFEEFFFFFFFFWGGAFLKTNMGSITPVLSTECL